MSAAVAVSGFQFPVSPDQGSRFTLRVSRDGAAREPGGELPAVVPAAQLGNRPAPATVLTGIEALDALTGGLPRGGLSEICGPASSGRSSVVLALMASLTQRGEVCALVDASDSFDPQSAEAAGVELRRLLWVRCSKKSAAGGRRSMASSEFRVASCRQKTPRAAADNSWPAKIIPAADRRPSPAFDSLEQALKATDLLLQGGGFGLVVVDLGDVPAQAARRVPLTSWFRFRRAVENTPTVLVVIEQEPYAKTCASVVVKLSAFSSQLSASRQSPVVSLQEKQEPAHARILAGFEISAEVLRLATQRKKPVQSTRPRWESRTAWAR